MLQNLFFGYSCLPSTVWSWLSSGSSQTFLADSEFFQTIERDLRKEIRENPEQIQEFLKAHLSIDSLESTSYQDLWDQLGCPTELYVQVRPFLHSSSINNLVEVLLGYAEFCRREGESLTTIQKMQESALKFALLSIAKNDLGSFFYTSKNKIAEIKDHIHELGREKIVQVPLPALEKIVKMIAPKWYSTGEISRCSQVLQKEMQTRLNKRVFQKSQDEYFVHSPIVCWMQPRSQEVQIACYNSSEIHSSILGGQEFCGVEAIFSLQGTDPIVYPTGLQVVEKTWGEKEKFKKKELSRRVPFYDSRPFTVYSTQDRSLITRGPLNQTLSHTIEDNPRALSALERLEICHQILDQLQVLDQRGLVFNNVRMQSIGLQRSPSEITGFLQSFSCLTCKGSEIPLVDRDMQFRLKNVAGWERAHSSHDRHAWILMLAELFFLFSPKQIQDLFVSESALEYRALAQLEQNLFSSHYRKVQDLWQRHQGLCPAFSEALLDYANTLRSSGEEGLQIFLLEQFALDAAVIPKIIDLLRQSVGAQHVDNIPSYEGIQQVLEEGRQELVQLQEKALLAREKTQITQVEEKQIQDLVKQALALDSSLVASCTAAMLDEIQSFLIEHPEVGAEKRFSKTEEIPFAFWVRIGRDNLEIDVIPSYLEPLGVGGNKKAKAVKCFSGNEPWTFKTLVRSWDFPRGHKIHHAILQIPEASTYFADLPKMHAAYTGKKGTPKWEGIQDSYQVNLYDAWKLQGIPIDSENSIPLTTLDFISFLEHVSQGIELIASHNISHGDLRRENVGIFLPSIHSYQVKITDFDHSQFFQTTYPDKRRYRYWNALRSQCGIISKETDLYSLVLLIGEILISDFSAEGNKTQEELLGLYRQKIPTDLQDQFFDGKITKENCKPLLEGSISFTKACL